jgi:hypothetical protein
MKSKIGIFVVGLVMVGLLAPMTLVGTSSEDPPTIDLTIIDIDAHRQLLDQDKFNIRIRIKNNGNHHVDAGFDVGLWQEAQQLPSGWARLGQIDSHEVTIDLGAGAWRDIYFLGVYWKANPVGSEKMRFAGFVDCNNEVINETYENNNFVVDDEWWY